MPVNYQYMFYHVSYYSYLQFIVFKHLVYKIMRNADDSFWKPKF